MEIVRFGDPPGVELDVCRRCGGVWFDHGEVQGLRALRRGSAGPRLMPGETTPVHRCHGCHEPIDRQDEQCLQCNRVNRLECPSCQCEMERVQHGDFRLDLCRNCRGTWFDREDVMALWTPRFDRALVRRGVSRREVAAMGADATSDILFHALFWGPDVVELGASAVGGIAVGAGEVLAGAPDALTAMPEVAGGVVEAVGEAAVGVFEAVAEIVGGLFG